MGTGRGIAEAVADIACGKRTNMKQILAAIEEQFADIAIVAVDKKQDTVLFGFDYLDEQERMCGSE